MTDKTLGQVAYEAWARVTWGSVEEAGEYAESAASSRDGWQAAAEAVVMQTTVDAVLLPQGRAVIEAAKAFVSSYSKSMDYALAAKAFVSLREAVEALEEVE